MLLHTSLGINNTQVLCTTAWIPTHGVLSGCVAATSGAAILTTWYRNNRKARVMNLGTECFAPNASPICCAYQGGFPGVGPVGGNTRNKVEDTIGKIVDKAPTQVRGQLQGMFGKAKKFF